jgi:hypothetical protein
MLGMDQMYKMALDPRIFPDQRLLAIMQGRDQSLPMAIAMAAKQQRDKLKTAEAGATAQQGMHQPTVKDQMLAKDLPPEHSGLAALPAENMAAMDEEHMAGGGIIAFADEGVVPPTDSRDSLTDDQINQLMSGKGPKKSEAETKKAIAEQNASISSALGAPGRALQAVKDYMYSDPSDKILAKAQAGRLTQADLTPPTTPNLVSQADALRGDAYRSAPAVVPGAAAAPAGGVTFDPTAGGNPAVAALRNKQQAGGAPGAQVGVGTPPGQGGAAANAAAQNVGIGQPPQRPDRFAGLGESQEAFDKKVADEKSAAQSDFLMNMGLKMATTVGPLGKAIGEGGLAGLPGLAASRKTIRELEKGRQDYQFNTAKAQAALDQGDEELALKYKELAEKSAYQMGLLAVERTKAGAYAASVGSKADQAERYKREEILKGFEARLKQMPLYATATPEKRRQMEQDAMTGAIQGYNDANAAISGNLATSGAQFGDTTAEMKRRGLLK